MKCPHCFISVHVSWQSTTILLYGNTILPGWLVVAAKCPNCRRPIIKLSADERGDDMLSQGEYLVYPRSPTRTDVSNAVPAILRNDYAEACNVLSISAKASAALSRRILQTILAEQGYQSSNLAKQINDVLNESDPSKVLPIYIRDVIDAIRHFGNFAAHTITDKTSLQVIDVEANEAEWCLEIVESLFEHYYITPARNQSNIDKLNNTLKKAGKPEAKS